jgi:prephenate dehydrogenase
MRLRDCVVTIIGLGQMGASIGRVLVARRSCRRVIGVSRKPRTRRVALRLRAAHEATGDFDAACARADLVLLATPARTILRQVQAAASVMKPGSLLIDVGSTKGAICRRAASALHNTGVRFVGGHPMAGHSGSGPLSSDPALFRNSPFVLSPVAGTRPADLRLAAELAAAVQARTILLDPDVHDRAVALSSHLPHVIAVALMLQAAGNASRLPLRLPPARSWAPPASPPRTPTCSSTSSSPTAKPPARPSPASNPFSKR